MRKLKWKGTPYPYGSHDSHRAKGNVLISNLLTPFLLPAGSNLLRKHQRIATSIANARAFRELGYNVYVLDQDQPLSHQLGNQDYEIIFGKGTNFKAFSEMSSKETVGIYFATGMHCSAQRTNQERRLHMLRERRDMLLPNTRPSREQEPGIERARAVIVKGNCVTADSYRLFHRNVFSIPGFTMEPSPSIPTRDHSDRIRKRFLWFGGGGLVHKGLDLVLEAFLSFPDLELYIAGPLFSPEEERFRQVYYDELFLTKNVHALGWVDIDSDTFQWLTSKCGFIILPSCAEGCCGSIITCMKAGLVPVTTPEAGIDISPDFGFVIEDDSIEGVRAAIRSASQLQPRILESMGNNAKSEACSKYTLARYYANMSRLLQFCLSGG